MPSPTASGSGDDVVEVIRLSLRRNWEDVYPAPLRKLMIFFSLKKIPPIKNKSKNRNKSPQGIVNQPRSTARGRGILAT